MARTRTTIRRVDPWSVLKFAFVANIVLLGVYLLVAVVAWAFVRRLELIETVCGLAGSVGIRDCAVDGQALFDTVLVLGLLGVVIQTGVFVFLAFLANLIFDLIGGIAITLDDDRAPVGGTLRRGVGSTVGSSRSTTASRRTFGTPSSRPGTAGPGPGGSGDGEDRTGQLPSAGPPSERVGAGDSSGASNSSSTQDGGSDEPLFGGR